jgi:hypothetical protein
MQTENQAATVNAPLSDEELIKNMRALKKCKRIVKFHRLPPLSEHLR